MKRRLARILNRISVRLVRVEYRLRFGKPMPWKGA